ncbi:pectinesterase, partial [Trifolium medium]|nr:pectinesterase [Trifolium medium]
MAFQDFDLVSERRKTNAAKHLRKKILFGVTSVLLVACVIAAAAFVIVKQTGRDQEKAVPKAKPDGARVDQTSRLVKVLCSNSNYKAKCETTLTEALKKDPKLSEPKDLLMVSM